MASTKRNAEESTNKAARGGRKKPASARRKAPSSGGTTAGSSGRSSGSAAAIAEQLLADENAQREVARYAATLSTGKATAATQAARVIGEVLSRKPELLVGAVKELVEAVRSPHKRAVAAAADALPVVAKHSPARVAKHLDTLKEAFDETTDAGRDGLVRTFAQLCIASVAYQKRLEPILTHALRQAEGKTLVRWTLTALPALKGEPHANARAVVEDRLYRLPRSVAQPIAEYLGVRLRRR